MSPQAALQLLDSEGRSFRRTARRCSLCADDAEDAYQRAVEILLTRAPELEPGRLTAWMHVVTRHEALAVRRIRERLLGPPPRSGSDAGGDRLDAVPAPTADPVERLERRERFESVAAALAALTRDQRLAIVLQACGYSYAEIAASRGWTYTKTNRCLAEGRARLRRLGAME